MRVLSLFSGIGAHDLGLVWAGMEIVGQVEIDEYCQKILAKHWPDCPRYSDITTVSADDIRRDCGRVDLVTGGFPCQDISVAGKQVGIDGARSGLFWEMLRIIEGIDPTWLLIENVPALRTNGADKVIGALEKLGYTIEPAVVGAYAIGSPQWRNRVWLVGYSSGARTRAMAAEQGAQVIDFNGHGTLPDTKSKGLEKIRRESKVSGPRNIPSVSDSNGELGEIGHGEIESRGSMVAAITSSQEPAGVRQPRPLSSSDGDTLRKQPIGFSQCQNPPFPALFGCEQNAWEAPRTIKRRLGRSAHGSTRGMALKAIGNSNPPQCAALLGRTIMKIARML